MHTLNFKMVYRPLIKKVYLQGLRSKFVHLLFLLNGLQNIAVITSVRKEYRGKSLKRCTERCLFKKKVFSCFWIFVFGIQGRAKTFISFHLARM